MRVTFYGRISDDFNLDVLWYRRTEEKNAPENVFVNSNNTIQEGGEEREAMNIDEFLDLSWTEYIYTKIFRVDINVGPLTSGIIADLSLLASRIEILRVKFDLGTEVDRACPKSAIRR